MSITDINQFYSLDGIGQTRRYRAYCKILVNGLDVTNRLDPYLVSVMVKDSGVWQADIELDDRDARLPIPPFNSELVIFLGWTSESVYRVFQGYIWDIEHGFGRRLGGRRMFIHAGGYQAGSAVKSPIQDHAGDGAPPGQMTGKQISFSEAARQFASHAGLNVSVGMTFSQFSKDYWSVNNESIMQFFSRSASDWGALWRLEGTNVVFNGINDFKKPALIAKWGDNLISWRIRPFVSRTLWAGATQEYYDHMLGQWQKLATEFGLKEPFGGWIDAIHKLPVPAPNAQTAEQEVVGAREQLNSYTGMGRIIINGEPKASWGGTVTVQGARPGVDGVYYIVSADHSYSRQGYVTTLEVMPNAVGGNSVTEGYSNVPTVREVITNPDGSVTTVYTNGQTTTYPNPPRPGEPGAPNPPISF